MDLVAALRGAGLNVEQSPSNPIHRADPRWADWYRVGLPSTLRRCRTFVIVVDNGWDSSTWMAQEAESALVSPGGLQGLFWNPLRVAVDARGMVGYLRTELPVGLAEAVKGVVEATSRRTKS
jgi:hypothetical protein